MSSELPQEVLERFPDRKIEGYEIVDFVGKGGQGYVVELQNGDGLRHIGKIVPRPWGIANSDDDLRNLRRGVETSRYLDHPGIQSVEDVIEIHDHEGRAFVIVKEYADGRSLKDMIQERGSVPLDTLLPIMYRTAEILNYAFDESKHPNVGVVLHRDLKPEHIFVDDEGNVKVVDWDIAKPESVGTTQLTGRAGTVNYQTIQAMSGRHSVDDDLAALGFVFAEALGLKGDFADGRTRDYPFPEWIPEEVRDVFGRALSPTEERRYHNGGEFLEDLGRVVGVEEDLESVVDDVEALHAMVVAASNTHSEPSALAKMDGLRTLENRLSNLRSANTLSTLSGPVVWGASSLFLAYQGTLQVIAGQIVPVTWLGTFLSSVVAIGLGKLYVKDRREIKVLEDRIATARLPEGVALGEGFDEKVCGDFFRKLFFENDDRNGLRCLDEGVGYLSDIFTDGFSMGLLVIEGDRLGLEYFKREEVTIYGDCEWNNYSHEIRSQKELDKLLSFVGIRNREVGMLLRGFRKRRPEFYQFFRSILPAKVEEEPSNYDRRRDEVAERHEARRWKVAEEQDIRRTNGLDTKSTLKRAQELERKTREDAERLRRAAAQRRQRQK